jgi:inner membrane transporter RhtA
MSVAAELRRAVRRRGASLADTAPPSVFILSSAVFHYLGPSLAALLFTRVGVLGVAWLRIASAAGFFLLVRRPVRVLRGASSGRRWLFVALGVLLAAMNSMFYLAIDRLPLSTVGAIEFLGVIVLAAIGTRTARNLAALILTIAGVAVLADVRLVHEPAGFAFAFANCVGFMLYIVLGHKIASTGPGDGSPGTSRSRAAQGIDQLGACMIIAAVAATPFGISSATTAFRHPAWLLWGIGVGLCSSVIPYVTDQLAMARLPRATFAFLLALLPASATVIGLIVLGQIPTWRDLVGIAAVIAGVALHRESAARA